VAEGLGIRKHDILCSMDLGRSRTDHAQPYTIAAREQLESAIEYWWQYLNQPDGK